MDINLLAPINTLGYGVVGLNVLKSLSRYNDVSLFPIGNIDAQEDDSSFIIPSLIRSQFFNPTAPSLRIFHQFSLAEHIGGGQRYAMPIFELNKFKPVELHHLRAQNKIIATSGWAVKVLLENGFAKNCIAYAPLGVDRSVFRSYFFNRVDGEPTVFLNCGKWEYRKGHDVLVEAFNKAFEPTDNVKLIMHCHNPCLSNKIRNQNEIKKYNEEWTKAYKTSKLGDRIVVSTARLPKQEDVARLMDGADCGVFPSRSEGWGLESSEMLAMGKHLIITNYSGHTDYVNHENSLLIEPTGLEDAHDGHWFDATSPDWKGQPGQWMELGSEQIDQMVSHLRDVHKRKQEGSLGTNEPGIATMAKLGWHNTAEHILGTLNR